MDDVVLCVAVPVEVLALLVFRDFERKPVSTNRGVAGEPQVRGLARREVVDVDDSVLGVAVTVEVVTRKGLVDRIDRSVLLESDVERAQVSDRQVLLSGRLLCHYGCN